LDNQDMHLSILQRAKVWKSW